MRIEDNILFLEDDIHDEMIEEFLEKIKEVQFQEIRVKNIILGSLIVQVLFVLSKEKKISFDDTVMEKFFENISFS